MAGLYIHAPYCIKKCSYCAFISKKKPSDVSGMCSALKEEFHRRVIASQYKFTTFYAGGGTPTLLPVEFWRNLVSFVKTPLLTELTIETNPSICDKKDYVSFRRAGFNRISIGVQSFKDKYLKILGRIHSKSEAINALQLARESGFKKINLDLIYGLPNQTLSEQFEDLKEAITFKPEHISAYELSLEPGTHLGEKGIKASENLAIKMYFQTDKYLTANGYIHYEVSSYALGDVNKSKHNSLYWNRTPYIGIGPAAHSFTGTVRSSNTSDIQRYESVVLSGQSAVENTEILSQLNVAHEILALGFRTTSGIDLAQLASTGYQINISELMETGFLTLQSNRLIPNSSGMLMADFLAKKA